jgi:hypothetical protein
MQKIYTSFVIIGLHQKSILFIYDDLFRLVYFWVYANSLCEVIVTVHPLGGDSDGSEMEVMRGIVGAMDLW